MPCLSTTHPQSQDPQRDSITHLTSLQHPSDLGIWEGCYDGTDWSDALRDEALTAALGGARASVLHLEDPSAAFGAFDDGA